MSKEEGERQKQSKELREQGGEPGQASIDTFRSSLAFPRPSTDRVTEKAERQAEKAERQAEKADRKAEKQVMKSERTLESDPEPHDRVLRTMRTPSMDGAPGQVTSTLPVVEEVGEASNTGQRGGGGQRRATVDPSALPTGRERAAMVNGDHLRHSHDATAGSSKSDPISTHHRHDHNVHPHTIDSVAEDEKGKGREMAWESMHDFSHLNEKRLPPIPFQPPPPPPPWRNTSHAQVSSN